MAYRLNSKVYLRNEIVLDETEDCETFLDAITEQNRWIAWFNNEPDWQYQSGWKWDKVELTMVRHF